MRVLVGLPGGGLGANLRTGRQGGGRLHTAVFRRFFVGRLRYVLLKQLKHMVVDQGSFKTFSNDVSKVRRNVPGVVEESLPPIWAAKQKHQIHQAVCTFFFFFNVMLSICAGLNLLQESIYENTSV